MIAIIRNEDEPKPVLMARFGLTDAQAEAVLELKLRNLAKLEKSRSAANKMNWKGARHLGGHAGIAKKLNALIKNELKQDADKYGDARRSPIVARQPSRALDITAVIGSEPVTLVLSEKGWIRAAKGHDIDPTALAFRSGDNFLSAALGRSNQPAYFLDSSGRSYAVPAHEFPSARTQGEPLTGRLNPPPGALFKAVLAGADDDWYLLATDSGYGFITQLKELYTKSRAGKALLTVPEHAKVLTPVRVEQPESDLVAIATAQGRLLVFPVSEIPILNKGKGNKLIQIQPADLAHVRLRSGYDRAVSCGGLKVHSGKRSLGLSAEDLVHYRGTRARRGNPLPKGFQRVSGLEKIS